jgi:subtilisin family serine protease
MIFVHCRIPKPCFKRLHRKDFMKKISAAIIVCLMIILFAGTSAWAGAIKPELYSVLQNANPDEEIQIIVTLADQVDPKNFKDKDKKLRRSRLLKALKNKAEKTQKNLTNYLKLNRVNKIKSFWVFNGLAATVKARMITKIALLADVESVSLDATITLPEPQTSADTGPTGWNISMIRAPELWALGFNGDGVVVASMDTGVDATHPDLASRWRGGSNSWFDPHGEHATPYDYSGHGTGVMGVLVGADSGGTAIGVAPGAQWISVKLFADSGFSNYSKIHAGFQWLLDPDGDSETDDAPDVVNNSWGFPDQRGNCINEFQTDIETLKTAGIAVVFSAGNEGPQTSTDESPANNPNGFAAGAVDINETIAIFSAHGPSACDQTIFPEVVAPGVNIYTADLGNYYWEPSGTSFAAPHVSGAMGLLMSIYPTLSISEIEAAITASAVDLGETGLDNTYGYGLLDVMAAYNLLGQSYSQPPHTMNDIVTIPRNSTTEINILANDVDPDGFINPESVLFRSGTKADTTVRGGTVAANQDGIVTYTPEGGGGPDYFWYRVSDNFGVTSHETRVRINRVRSSDGEQTAIPNSSRSRTR